MRNKIINLLRKIQSITNLIFNSIFGYSEAEERLRETKEKIMQLNTYNFALR